MLSIIEALRIMCDHFEDDRQLGRYIRMLTKIPIGSLDIGEFKVKLDKFKKDMGLKHFADDFHEGKDSTDSLTLDEMLSNIGVKKNGEK